MMLYQKTAFKIIENSNLYRKIENILFLQAVELSVDYECDHKLKKTFKSTVAFNPGRKLKNHQFL